LKKFSNDCPKLDGLFVVILNGLNNQPSTTN